MSLSFENSGNLVQGAILIFSGHRPFELLAENAKILKFAINGTQVAVIEWPMSISTVERVHRFWGIKKSGSMVALHRHGRHANVHTLPDNDKLDCFHPQGLDECWALAKAVSQ